MAVVPCMAMLISPLFYTYLTGSVVLKFPDPSTKDAYSYDYCATWTLKGDLEAAKPTRFFPDTNSTGTNSTGTNSTGTNSTGTNSTGTNSTGTNSTGTNSTGTNSTGIGCVERAKSYCFAKSATFDVEQCSLINVTGSFATGAPLLETIKFNCGVVTTTANLPATTISVTDDVTNDVTNDVTIVYEDDVGVVDSVAQILSANLIYILPGVLVFLLIAVVAIYCIIKRRRRQSAGNEGDPHTHTPHTHHPQFVDGFAINFPWREQPGQTGAENVAQSDETRGPDSEEGKSYKESKKKRKKDKDGVKVSTLAKEATPPQQPTSEAGTSDREAEKQRKKENKRNAKEEFKKVSTLVQGIPPQQPTSEAGTSDREAEKQRKKENKRKAKEEFKKVSTLVQGIPPQPPTSGEGTSDRDAEKQRRKEKKKNKKAKKEKE